MGRFQQGHPLMESAIGVVDAGSSPIGWQGECPGWQHGLGHYLGQRDCDAIFG